MVPATADDILALASLKQGEALEGPWRKKQERVLWRHRKFFAMLDYAFENWEPHGGGPDFVMEDDEGFKLKVRGEMVPVLKNRERFRKDLIILAGYYEATFNIKNEVRLEAKSMAFANMDDDEFTKLYYDVHDVIRRHILRNYSREDFDRVLAEHERFQ